MRIEHRDLLISYGHLYLAWNEPAVPPPGECLPATELFRRLAREMASIRRSCTTMTNPSPARCWKAGTRRWRVSRSRN